MGIVRGLTSQTCGSNPLLSTTLKSRHAVSGYKQSPCSDVLHCLQQVGQAPGGVAGTIHLLSRWWLTYRRAQSSRSSDVMVLIIIWFDMSVIDHHHIDTGYLIVLEASNDTYQIPY